MTVVPKHRLRCSSINQTDKERIRNHKFDEYSHTLAMMGASITEARLWLSNPTTDSLEVVNEKVMCYLGDLAFTPSR